jgi:hypothetical protein
LQKAIKITTENNFFKQFNSSANNEAQEKIKRRLEEQRLKKKEE